MVPFLRCKQESQLPVSAASRKAFVVLTHDVYIPGCVATAPEEEDMALRHQYPGHAGAHARLAAEACAGRTTATEHTRLQLVPPSCPKHTPAALAASTDGHLQQADKASTPPMHQHMYNLLAVADRCALISRSHSNRFFCSVWETVLFATWTPKTQQRRRNPLRQGCQAHKTCQHIAGMCLAPLLSRTSTAAPPTDRRRLSQDGAQEPLGLGADARTHSAQAPPTATGSTSTPAAQQHHLRWQALQDSSMMQLNRPRLPAVLLRTIIVAAAHSHTLLAAARRPLLLLHQPSSRVGAA